MSDTEFWQSLEQKQGTAVASTRWNPFDNDFLSRRDFMEWSGGMMAVLGIAGCTRQPKEKLIPYTKQPERVIPGRPLFYASALSVGGPALGVLIESHQGRPTKVEGNPEHPGSLGGSDIYSQASVLSLYDPDRSRVLLSGSQVTFWSFFLGKLGEVLAEQRPKKGAGLRVLTETVTSPSLAAQMEALLKKYPEAKWVQYDPIHRDNELAGLQKAFGKKLSVNYRFDKAKTVVSLDSDIFGEPSSVRWVRDFSKSRSLLKGRREMSRLFAVEATPSVTGSMADVRIASRASHVESIAAALGSGLGLGVSGGAGLSAKEKEWVASVVADVKKHSGQNVFVAGRWQSPLVHSIAAALNARFGGQTVRYTQPIEARASMQTSDLATLTDEMGAGQVDCLVVLGGNPVYNAPADIGFAQALEKVKTKIHFGLYQDETSAKCDWHVPQAHPMEVWGDLRAADGTVAIQQPLIEPLFGGKAPIEMVAALHGETKKKSYDLVRSHWKGRGDAVWKKAVHDGMVPGTTFNSVSVSSPSGGGWKSSQAGSDFEILFKPDPTVWDGRFANNGWLQECPKPLTKLTWDNTALMGPATAAELGVRNEDVVRIKVGEDTVEAPVWILPGHAAKSITLHLGYGRTKAGRIGNGKGFDAYPLRTAGAAWVRSGAVVEKAGKQYSLACTQEHHSMEDRAPVKRNSLVGFAANEKWAEDHHHGPKILEQMDVGTAGGENAPKAEADYQWGMAINLSACNGCNACVVACQAENNIPVVGKLEVQRGREMHWMRIDRYFEGDLENPVVHNQPVACQQCETAPCEVVCPVGATVHDNEGLNNMVYNRCVGTKYCSNNCPYKVRRFNFFEYSNMKTPELKMVHNPDVTVRSRGVMEKCTYCVQRISAGRSKAKREGRKILDGEVKTACQTACPAEAIVFGDISDPNSLVSMIKEEPLNYSLLGVLNTQPRTTYLAKVTNPVGSTMEAKDEHESSH